MRIDTFDGETLFGLPVTVAVSVMDGEDRPFQIIFIYESHRAGESELRIELDRSTGRYIGRQLEPMPLVPGRIVQENLGIESDRWQDLVPTELKGVLGRHGKI